MARRRRRRYDEKPGRAGFLVVDKPQGWTSHDVVDAARLWLGTGIQLYAASQLVCLYLLGQNSCSPQ